MTKREREQVVELLRCGADVQSLVAAGYATGHCDGINPCDSVYAHACDAYMATARIPSVWYHARPRRGLLEAALRVELEEWP